MKKLTIEVVEYIVAKDMYWITGRCCGDDIAIGDRLCSESEPALIVSVKEIEVYSLKETVLHHGFVGGVIVEILEGKEIKEGGLLVSEGTLNGSEAI